MVTGFHGVPTQGFGRLGHDVHFGFPNSTQGYIGSMSVYPVGGRRSPAVVCWASDHWVASSNPHRGKFRY